MEKNKSIWVLESYTCNRKPELYVDLDIIVLNEINKEDSLDYVIKKLNENLPEKVRKLKRNRIKESHQFLLDKIGSGAYLMLLCNDCGMENKCYRTLENSEEYNLYLFFF